MPVSGTLIGPYRLVELLGTGGMGEVWLAEQREPVRREVALKMLKLGMDSDSVVRRFEQERRSLAAMEHPNIATVFDAGVTGDGVPYFVMERVQAVDIVAFCNAHRLGIRDRVRILATVCRAVQHAHTKGVIHRDLKPGNIMVSEHDGRPVPKIIDFGIAKAVAADGEDELHLTQTGHFVGTVAYMAPEQALGESDVDARADVYALGVVLYELLTGVLPFHEGQLRGLAAIGALLEKDAPTPSSRVKSIPEGREQVAELRGVTGPVLLRALRGELDWIVGRALEKERDRRYQTPNELAADLDRFLDHRPVEAGPPSALYRARKFLRRNRLAAGAGAVAVLALAVGATAATVGLLEARASAAEARREADRSQAINGFLQEALGQADPWRGGDREVTLVAALDGAVDRLDEHFADQPAVAAEVRLNIGRTYDGLGRVEAAERLHREALEAQLTLLGEASDEVAVTRASLAGLLAGQGRYDEAIPLHQAAVDARSRTYGPDHPETLALARPLVQALINAGRFDEADARIAGALAALDRAASDTLRADWLLAEASLVVQRDGDHARVDSIVADALALARSPGRRDIRLSNALDQGALAKMNIADYEAAEALFEESVALRREIFGDDHPQVAAALENMGTVFFRTERYDRVLALLEEVRAMRERALGPRSEPVGRTEANMATVLGYAGQPARALEHNTRALDILTGALGEIHPDIGALWRTQGLNQFRIQRYDASAASFRRAIAIDDEVLSEDNIRMSDSLMLLGTVLIYLKEFEESERTLLRSLELSERHFAAGRLQSLQGRLDTLARLYDAWGRPADAARYRERIATAAAGKG